MDMRWRKIDVDNESAVGSLCGGNEHIALVRVEPTHGSRTHFPLPPPGRSSGSAYAEPSLLRPPVFEAGVWNPRRPLSEFRSRCDTNTNFHYIYNELTLPYQPSAPSPAPDPRHAVVSAYRRRQLR